MQDTATTETEQRPPRRETDEPQPQLENHHLISRLLKPISAKKNIKYSMIK